MRSKEERYLRLLRTNEQLLNFKMVGSKEEPTLHNLLPGGRPIQYFHQIESRHKEKSLQN